MKSKKVLPKCNFFGKENYAEGTRHWTSSIMHRITVVQFKLRTARKQTSLRCHKLHLSTNFLGKECLRLSNRGYFTVFQMCVHVIRNGKISEIRGILMHRNDQKKPPYKKSSYQIQIVDKDCLDREHCFLVQAAILQRFFVLCNMIT